MDLRQLRSFAAVVEEGSINRAAIRLHCAQPSVSVQMRHLEEELGLPLLDRRARGVVPTAAGERFYADCLKILGDVESARQRMDDWSREVSGALAAGIIPTISKGVLPKVLPDYTNGYPNVDIRIAEAYSGTLTGWVLDGDLDFALVTEPPHDPSLAQKIVSSEPLVLVSGRASRLVPGEPVNLREIAPIKLLFPSQRHSLRTIIERHVAAGDIAVDRIIEIDGLYATLQFLRHSDWSSIIPVTTLAEDIDDPRLTVSPIVTPVTRLDYYLIHQTRRPLTQPALRLIERLTAVLSESAATWDAFQAAAVQRANAAQ
jgi:LysR family transcriptional regulator, nitrogen assimilation regulatory protein